jgi:hypothetical protein
MINSFSKIWLDSFQIKNLPILLFLVSAVFISYVLVSVSRRMIPDKKQCKLSSSKKIDL